MKLLTDRLFKKEQLTEAYCNMKDIMWYDYIDSVFDSFADDNGYDWCVVNGTFYWYENVNPKTNYMTFNICNFRNDNYRPNFLDRLVKQVDVENKNRRYDEDSYMEVAQINENKFRLYFWYVTTENNTNN